ncbi:hypothetical protein D3C72_2105510 [compost metagenome]
MNIQINNIAGNILFTEGPGQLQHLLLIHIAVARLMIADRPLGRKRNPSGQRGVSFDHILHLRPVNKINVISARGAANRKRNPV